MRTAILASGIILGLLSIATAMPMALPAAASRTVQIHGCHPYYAHDWSGWHRHERDCALPALPNSKSRTTGRD
jgi:hypothetical protein